MCLDECIMGSEGLELYGTGLDELPYLTLYMVLTLFGAVWNAKPVIFEISSATLTSKPFLVFKPYTAFNCLISGIKGRKTTYSADRSATLCEHAQTGKGVLHTLNAVRQLLDVSAELLAKRERRSVLGDGISS